MRTLESKQVYANARLSVREDTVRRPDGSTTTYDAVDSPDIALIVPVDGDLLLDDPCWGWEIPSGLHCS